MNRRNFLQFATGLITLRVLTTNIFGQNIPKRRSMKGFELYSWQAKNAWQFSILIGTNRNKQGQEIKAPEVVLHNLKALEDQLGKLAKGEQLIWDTNSFEWLNLPPLDQVQAIRRRCKTQGLVLQISSKTPR
jgi:hypothetical protein